jgi:hypothetical protein
MIYQFLWRNGGGKSNDTFCEVACGYNAIAHQLHVTDKTVKRNLRSLHQKLAIDPMPGTYDPKTETPTRYRVYSFTVILKRRKAAGFVGYIRNRAGGVALTRETGTPAGTAHPAVTVTPHQRVTVPPAPVVTVSPHPMATVPPSPVVTEDPRPMVTVPPLSRESLLEKTPTYERAVPIVEMGNPSARWDAWLTKEFRKDEIRSYLVRQFPQAVIQWTPGPDDEVLDPLASLITSEKLFWHFQERSRSFTPEKGWRGFIPIAQACVTHEKSYDQAKAAIAAFNGGTRKPPRVGSDEYMAKMRAEIEEIETWQKKGAKHGSSRTAV